MPDAINTLALRARFKAQLSLVVSETLICAGKMFDALFIIIFFLTGAVSIRGSAQIVYSQNFNTTLGASGWTNTNLTVPWTSGTFLGIFSNNWYVNDAESGMPVNTCGAGGMSNPTLHIGAVGFGALGAAYVANAQTNRRISSPNINTTGYAGMTLSFNFIANGVGAIDKAYFQYSLDGGVTWITPIGVPTSTTPALQVGSNWANLKSQVCSPQGRWTNVTWAMPVACESIPNLRIGFVWQNGNTTPGATDPSLAVDDVVISVILSPVELSSLEARCENSKTRVEWTTQSESNNDYFTIVSSSDLLRWEHQTNVSGSGNSTSIKHYSFEHPTSTTNLYYRLSQTDFDGRKTILRTISLKECVVKSDLSIYPNPTSNLFYIKGVDVGKIIGLRIFDRYGRLTHTQGISKAEGEQIEIMLPHDLSSGMYVLILQMSTDSLKEFKLIIN